MTDLHLSIKITFILGGEGGRGREGGGGREGEGGGRGREGKSGSWGCLTNDTFRYRLDWRKHLKEFYTGY